MRGLLLEGRLHQARHEVGDPDLRALRNHGLAIHNLWLYYNTCRAGLATLDEF
jgi:hypothetical protein